MDVWECDLVDVQSLAKHNDGYRFLLTVIDVFSKYLHIVPLKSKTGTAVSAAFETVSNDAIYLKPVKRRPVWVQTDRGREFLNASFQNLLKREGIQFHVCKNPDIKCAVIERAHRTMRDYLYQYLTPKNTYKYIDVLHAFVIGYNTRVSSLNGMAPANITDKHVLAI
jgi:transposase InsO family protein